MKKSLIGLALCLAYCTVLTGCGGGDSSPSVITPTPTPTPTPAPAANLEQKIDRALAINETAAETIEPDSTDDATIAEPDNTEPKSL